MFQRLMNTVLRPYTVAYIDDTVIHSTTWVDHLYHLQEVLSELCRAGLTANPKKCHLGLIELQYLGYRISWAVLKLQQKKMEAVQAFPQSNTKKQVCAFLGLAGYYRQFVPNFSSIASPCPV